MDRLFDGEDFGLGGCNETLSGVLPCATSYDVALRTPDMTRSGIFALYVPSGGS